MGGCRLVEFFLVGITEVEPFDRIAGIEWNAVEFYRICCMARSLRSLRQVATLRHGLMTRRSASFRSCIQGTRGYVNFSDYVIKVSIRVVSMASGNKFDLLSSNLN